MKAMKSVFFFYYDGFKNMTVGKTLWKVIIIKLVVILYFLNQVLYEKNFKSEYETYEQKSEFVSKNLIRSE
ncbi:MAG: DUF4492 domain-containing protein [Campylobacterota bacterium]